MVELVYFRLPRVSVTGKTLWSSEHRTVVCNTRLTTKAVEFFVGGISRFSCAQLIYRLEKLQIVEGKIEHLVSPPRKYRSPDGILTSHRQLLNIFDHYLEFIIEERREIERELESRGNRENDSVAAFLARKDAKAAALKERAKYKEFKKHEKNINRSFQVEDPIMYALRSVPPKLKPPLRRRIEDFCRVNNGKITGLELRRIYSVTNANLPAKARSEIASGLSRVGILPRMPGKKRKPIALLENLLQYALESGREIYELSDDGSLQDKAIALGLDDINEAIDYCREGIRRIRKARRKLPTPVFLELFDR
jgi:hypothetical protein